MSTIATINEGDQISSSRANINANFAALNADKIETSAIDTDTALAANSDAKIPSQKAVKAYVDTQGGANASETVRGLVEEATDAEVTAGATEGSTGAKLFVSPGKLATRLASLNTHRNGLASKNLADASTIQNIAHGLGKTPKKIVLHYTYDSGTEITGGVGQYDAGGQHSLSWYSAGAIGSSSTAAIVLYETSGALNQTGVVSVDATNITITWTKNGSPAGTATILWSAEG